MVSSFLKALLAGVRGQPAEPDDPERLAALRDAARERARARLAAHPWPPALLDLLAVLRRDGRQAYLVGGAVRDVLLGRAGAGPFDVATDLTPREVEARFTRVVPIGIEHGTVLIVENGLEVECTTFRSEAGYPDGRRPESVTFGRDPVADLGRRDLTVNAIAWDPAAGRLLDPHGGALDLERRVLRAVGEPRDRFREDALRPLRVARFAATLEMLPEPATRAALSAALDRAGGVSWERVRGELERMLEAPRPSIGLELMRESGLLELWLPELARCYGVLQNRWHAYDVYEHSLYTLDAAPRDKPRVRWAALLHDIGKPATRVVRDGEGTFYDHQIVGARMADALLERLRFPADERQAIVHLVREHMFDYRPEWSDAAVRRWVRRVGVDAIADLFDLRIADYLGNGLRAGFPSYLEEMRARIERVIAASSALSVTDLAIDGRDVMRALGVPPGRVVGETLARLLDEVLERPEDNRREHLLERLVALRAARAVRAADRDP
jgi:putative nucleotidyltransferase with HDIG domain